MRGCHSGVRPCRLYVDSAGSSSAYNPGVDTGTMRLRVMTSADIPAGMRLKERAGWNQTAADWRRFLERSPEGCFVAEVGAQVCGTVTTIPSRADSPGLAWSWWIPSIAAEVSVPRCSNGRFTTSTSWIFQRSSSTRPRKGNPSTRNWGSCRSTKSGDGRGGSRPAWRSRRGPPCANQPLRRSSRAFANSIDRCLAPIAAAC